MIEKIKIKGLFGFFDYDIQLPKEGEVMILTGPNGYGKTTILRIIASLLEGDLLSIRAIPLKSMQVVYQVGHLIINYVKPKKELGGDIEFSSDLGGDLEMSFLVQGDAGDKIVKFGSIGEERIRRAKRKSHINEWDDFYFHESEFYGTDSHSVKETEEKRREKDKKILEGMAENVDQKSFLIQYNSTLQHCRMVPSQRLYNIGNKTHENTIESVSNDFCKFLGNLYFDFLRGSQSRDSNFIHTLLDGNEAIGESEYNLKVNELKEIVSKAQHYDLLDTLKLPAYKEGKGTILNYYIEEATQKLKIYRKPIAELDLFSRLLDNKRMVNKRIEFSRRHGIRFRSTDRDLLIDINKLSSGEKNEIIMLHDFIFNLKEGSFLLVDEPEISLHVAWQHEFMDDLEEIAKQKRLRVVVATHSPQIIGDRWDNCYDLKEQMEDF
ncbi:MAG: AAA family ATPase [Muribaculaceae bacterium]|nr:AAA family ATPase [Muribaculaceae bacterium]